VFLLVCLAPLAGNAVKYFDTVNTSVALAAPASLGESEARDVFLARSVSEGDHEGPRLSDQRRHLELHARFRLAIQTRFVFGPPR
jgi:hypothetical protein